MSTACEAAKVIQHYIYFSGFFFSQSRRPYVPWLEVHPAGAIVAFGFNLTRTNKLPSWVKTVTKQRIQDEAVESGSEECEESDESMEELE